MPWSVVYTKPRQEFRVKDNLEHMGLNVSFPLVSVEKIRGGQLVIDSEPLFQRYVFIRNDMSVFQRTNHTIKNVRGVLRLLTVGSKYAEVDDQRFDQMIAHAEKLSVNPSKVFQRGQKIIFSYGVYEDVRAIFQEAQGDRRVILLFEMLSKSVSISVPLAKIRQG